VGFINSGKRIVREKSPLTLIEGPAGVNEGKRLLTTVNDQPDFVLPEGKAV
jgi:hypothetical protein